MAERKSRARIWLNTAIRTVIACGLLGYVIYTNRDQFALVFQRPVNLGAFAVAFGLYTIGFLLAFVRWYWLARTAGLTFRLRDAMRLGFIGLPFNLIIPGAVGGDVIKAAYFCREQRSKTRPIASIVLDRLLGLLGLFILAGVVGGFAWPRLDPLMRRLVVTAWGIALLTTLIIAAAFVPLQRIPIKFAHKLRTDLGAVGASYRNQLGSVLGALVMSVVTHAFNVLAFYMASRSLFPRIPSVLDHFLIVPLVLFSTAIPLPFAALGASEKISEELFKLADYSGGAVAMVAMRILQLIAAGMGLIVYMANQSQVRELQHRAQELSEEPDGLAAGDGAIVEARAADR